MSANQTRDARVGVLLADDAAVIRKAVTDLLLAEPSIRIVGEATNFEETLSLAAALRPDVILLDIHMPDDADFAPDFVARQLESCGARILAMSISGGEDRETAALAARFGASVLLEKSTLYETLIPAILEKV